MFDLLQYLGQSVEGQALVDDDLLS
jgi:hypothetical protein